MLFKEIPGQNHIKEKLIQTIKVQRISHAQLFTGNEGCGKLATAIAYAQYINCRDKQDNDSCGTCPSCKKYNKLIHPDLHFVFPVVKSTKNTKPVSSDYINSWREFINSSPFRGLHQWLNLIGNENAQGGIFTHESSEILKKINLKSFEAEYKVMIIWHPDKMHQSCANKLLKILEEPPDKTLFLLVTENPGDLLPTILSRTQIIKFPPLPKNEMLVTIKEMYQLEGNDAEHIAAISNGNIVKAGEIALTSEEDTENLEQFISLMRLCYKYNVELAYEWVNNMAGRGREKQKGFLKYGLHMLRDNIIMNITGGQTNKMVFQNPEEAEFSANLYKYIDQQNIFRLTQLFEEAHLHIERNGYDRLVLLDLSLNVMKAIRKKV